MAVKFYPIIKYDDYAVFRKIISQLPDTHNEWEHHQNSENLRWTGTGHLARGIEVKPDAFRARLIERKEKPSILALTNYAADLASHNRE